MLSLHDLLCTCTAVCTVSLIIAYYMPGSKFQIVHVYGLTLHNSYCRQTRHFPWALQANISMQVV